MITLKEFTKSFQAVRKRTIRYIKVIPETHVSWSISEGKFSIGELVVHIGSTELMFCYAARTGVWKYPGHKDIATSVAEAEAYLHQCHDSSMYQLSNMTESDFQSIVKGPDDTPVAAWRILTTMSEHEIHHRGQMSAYLQFLQVEPPQIFDRKVEAFEMGHSSLQN